jgi:hypothetical protein
MGYIVRLSQNSNKKVQRQFRKHSFKTQLRACAGGLYL